MKNIPYELSKKALIVSDIDGTILDSNGTLRHETQKSINNYIKYGLFTVATGRSYTMTCKILKGINFSLPIITNDGACIYTPHGELIECFAVEKNKLLDPLNVVCKTHTPLAYCQKNGKERVFWLGNTNKLTKMYFENRVGDDRFQQVSDVNRLFQGNVIAISFIEDYKNALLLKKKLNDLGINDIFLNKDAYIDGMFWIKIKNKYSTKGQALRKLAEILDSDTTISIGNDSNDLDMLEQSDISICVENATNVVKQNSMYVIDSNENNGVGKLLDGILRKNPKLKLELNANRE